MTKPIKSPDKKTKPEPENKMKKGPNKKAERKSERRPVAAMT